MSTTTAPVFTDHLPGSRAAPGDHLPAAIGADSGELAVRGVGTLGYYKDTTGSGPTVVLVHSVNAAASSYEMRPLFESLRGKRRVFALDLPGFGRSERGDRDYSPTMFADAIERFIIDVASPQGQPVDAVGLSLSSEFLARLAVRSPVLFRSLTLVSPTGFGPVRASGGPARGLFRGALSLGPLSAGIFRLLRTEGSIRYFLSKSFVGRPDEGLVRYSLQTAAAQGARFAPVKFVRGDLFTPDAYGSLYRALKVPTKVVYDRDPYTTFERVETLAQENPLVTAHRVAPSLGMAQFERPADVVQVIEAPLPGDGATP